MTTTDTDALAERIARAFWEYEAGPSGIPWERFAVRVPERAAERMRNAAPVLPIVAEEVRKAKAEALREMQEHHEREAGKAETITARGIHLTIADGARTRADEYETGDQR